MPININEELKFIATTLNESRVDYALCGGLAVAIYGFPRATMDIDIILEETTLESATSAVRSLGYVRLPDLKIFNMGKGRDLRVHCFEKTVAEDTLSLDFGIVPPFLERIWRDRVTVRIDNYELSVVSLDGLKQMKRMSGRPQDLADIERLEELERDDGD
ncbi:MAG: hypothetical protein JW941_04035 [Candidatus Coatesbacteria bacterium]|nr:hypothetical protein [Candidatus Coatesbacteria bacterium]